MSGGGVLSFFMGGGGKVLRVGNIKELRYRCRAQTGGGGDPLLFFAERFYAYTFREEEGEFLPSKGEACRCLQGEGKFELGKSFSARREVTSPVAGRTTHQYGAQTRGREVGEMCKSERYSQISRKREDGKGHRVLFLEPNL